MALFLLRLVVLSVLFGAVIHFLRRSSRRNLVNGAKGPRLSAYEVLGVSPSASEGEIKEAYHRELAKYHPDKVAHLGEELQILARNRTAEIISSYQSLKK